MYKITNLQMNTTPAIANINKNKLAIDIPTISSFLRSIIK